MTMSTFAEIRAYPWTPPATSVNKETAVCGLETFLFGTSPSHLCLVYGTDRKYIQDTSKDRCMQVGHGWHGWHGWYGWTHACVLCMCADNRLSPVSFLLLSSDPFFFLLHLLHHPFHCVRPLPFRLSCLPSCIPSIRPTITITPLLLLLSPTSSPPYIFSWFIFSSYLNHQLLARCFNCKGNASQERMLCCIVLCCVDVASLSFVLL